MIFIIIIIVLILFYYLYTSTREEPLQNNQEIKIEKFKTKIKTNDKKELFELYFKGVPDTYNKEGELLKGIKPDATKSIFYLNEMINEKYKENENKLKMAKIYHQGMYNFDPNLDKAEEIYLSLSNTNIPLNIRNQVNEGLANIHMIKVRKWLNLPEEIPIVNVISEKTGDIIIDEVLNFNEVINEFNNSVNEKYDDPQNTHDSQVLSTIKISLNNLKNTHQRKNEDTCFNEVKIYILSKPDSDKKKAAIKSLNDIKAINQSVLNNYNEMNILQLVWNRITSYLDNDKIENAKETLYNELADMQEFGETVCSTGRITRLIDTLNGIDEEVIIKPSYAINEEMMNKSSLIREKMLSNYNDNEKNQLSAGTHAKQNEFDKNLKETIIIELKKDYVNSGILTESKFNEEIKKWIEFI